MIILSKEPTFPPATYADEQGLLAIGGDLSVPRLLNAYRNGIFPWYNVGQPILWHSPDPRMVLFPCELKIHKSMRQVLRKHTYRITYNQAFEQVIAMCGTIDRNDQDGTWITNEMFIAYNQMFEAGHAKSVEVWEEDQLVAGLYGVDLPDKKIFCGESMFSTVSNGSKIALIDWVQKLKFLGYKLIDCQVYTSHLANLGAREIDRKKFLSYLA